MNKIRISDVTMKQAAEGFSLSFKEKIELAKLLDKLGVDLIELEGIVSPRIDGLRIKSIAAAVKDSAVAVPVQLDSDISVVWNALQTAKHPRLQVCAPVSSVQMEYLFHKKPEAMLAAVYLDGGIGQTRKLIHTLILDQEQERIGAGRDFKTALQELVQRESGQVLSYRVVGESGPDHCKTFDMEVLLNSKAIGAGQGRSKKEAEHAAAKAAVLEMEKKHG